jgi:PAS domain S-box-containing protein
MAKPPLDRQPASLQHPSASPAAVTTLDASPRPGPRASAKRIPASRFRGMVELAPDATVVVDRQWRIVLVNRQTELLFGYAREDLLGQPVEILIPERFHVAHRQHRADYLAAPRIRKMGADFQLAGRRRDGSEFPIEMGLSPLERAGELLVIASIRDVSEFQRLTAARLAAEAASEELRQLQSITDIALVHPTLDALLPALLDRIRTVMAVDNVAILLASEEGADGQELVLRAARGPEASVGDQVRVPIGRGVAGRIAATRDPLIIDDLATVEVVPPYLRERFSSLVGVPLVTDGRLIGVLHAASASPRHFTEDDVRLLQLVAERIAYALDHARLHEALHAAHQAVEASHTQLRRLQAITDTALSHLGVDDLLHALLDRIHTVMEVEDVAILLLEADGQHLKIRAARGLADAQAAEATIAVGQGFSGRVAASRVPLRVDDLPTFDILYRQMRETQRSAVGVPLLLEDRLLGVVYVGSVVPCRFSEQDVQLLQRVADRIALAIDRAHLFEAEQAARREAQAARRQAERQAELLDRLFEATVADGLTLYDAQGRVVRQNAAVHRLLALDAAPPGYAQWPVQERLALFAECDAQGHPLAPEDEPIQRALAGEALTGAAAVDLRLRALDGRAVEVSVSAAPLHDQTGHILGALVVLHDQTERNRLAREREEALRSSEAWFRSMADTAPVLLWVADLDGLVTFLNAPWLQFTGQSLEHELGNGWAEGVHPEDYQRCLDTYRVAFEARQPFTMEYRLRRFDGEYRCLVDSGVPRWALDGTFLGYIGSAIDITERERLEREREEARANELAMRDVIARLDTFIGMAAHDLRSPLTVSTVRLQLATNKVARAAAQAQRGNSEQAQMLAQIQAHLESAEQAHNRLLRLVELLLDVSRARNGTLRLQVRPCHLDALVRESVEEQRLLMPERTLTLDIPSAVPVVVLADADRLGQVLTNYLTNAVRFTPADQPVEVALRVVGEVAHVEVRDHGPGIPPEEQQAIWERFLQAHAPQQMGPGTGLGLGLYIVKRLVELHGGTVGVESQVGHGATFWFTVPLQCLQAVDVDRRSFLQSLW